MIHKSGAQGLRFLAALKTAARLPLRCHEYQWCPAAPVILKREGKSNGEGFPAAMNMSIVIFCRKLFIIIFLLE